MSAAIELQKLGKTFESNQGIVHALEEIELSVQAGEFVSVLGPSGCGKSTMLRILAGLEPYTSGQIICDDRVITGPGADRGMVFQAYTLFPWLTVRENIEYGLKLAGKHIFERRRISGAWLDRIGLSSFAKHYPNQLSGGMKQRVAIARALANKPKVLLMDEPFGALDAHTKLMMQRLLQALWVDERPTVVFITHDVDEAIYLGQRVVVMGARPGRIVKEYQVHLPEKRTEEVRGNAHFIELRKMLLQDLEH